MSRLFATIDWKNNTVHFSGPGTYDARDEIKSLGIAVWRGEKKVWEVRVETLDRGELENAFPGIVIDEVESSAGQSSVGQSSAAQSPGLKSPTVKSLSEKSSSETASKKADLPNGVPQGLSVSQVILKARQALKSAFPGSFCVYGVLSQVKARDGGTVFMELAEADRPDERLSCIIWGHAESMCRKLHEAGFRLEANLQVMFEVELNLNNKDGRLSLRVLRIVAEYTLAKLAAVREQTNERLKQEGIFQKNKTLSLPFLPKRLALITSASGTVINDFRASLDEAKFGFELFWYPVQVQGLEAKKSLVRAIEYFSRQGDVDAILVFRGGGSQADLAVFNEYEVAKAICLSSLPVLSAIGHQEDQSSAQDVSWKALGVPKDLGRYFADIVLNYRLSVTQSASSVLRLGSAKLEQWTQAVTRSPILSLASQLLRHRDSQLQTHANRLKEGRERRLEQAELRFLNHGRNAISSMAHLIEKAGIRIDGIERLVQGASPETQLRRGFAYVREVQSGKYILDGNDLASESEILISFRDGERKAVIGDKE